MSAGSALPVAVGQNPWQELLFDTNILPAQFFGPRMRLCTVCPEAALMHAVLEDALACFQKQFAAEGRRVQREAREAEAWFLSEDAHWPFSFVSVCAVLGLEPEAIRQQLQRWRHSLSQTSPRNRERCPA